MSAGDRELERRLVVQGYTSGLPSTGAGLAGKQHTAFARSAAVHTMELVTPGQTINAEAGFLRGHGTYVRNGVLIASVAGVVQRVNKLISVTPLKNRFGGQVRACTT